MRWFFTGLPGRIRTFDPMIKSHLLCQLSYGEEKDGQRYKKIKKQRVESRDKRCS